MASNSERGNAELRFLDQVARSTGRRRFLQWSGLTIGVLAIGCDDDDDDDNGNGVDLGTGDTGVLNYAYALEQLEAAFYTRVMEMPYTGMTPIETQILTDIRDHEIIHRDFLAAALGSSAIPALEVTFEEITFTNRGDVLAAAREFEDLGVGAYNGAGRLLSDPGNLLVAGKIVSVEARHASTIRDLINPFSEDFAATADDQGLDPAFPPDEVLAQADTYIITEINASGLA